MSDQSAYGNQSNPYSDYTQSISSPPTSTENPLPSQFDFRPIMSETNAMGTGGSGGGDGGFSRANRNIVYNSYAGVDIVAQVIIPNEAPVTLGELQTFSYSVHRENAPVRVLGHVSPVGFLKGARTIAGSMIFTVFNFYAFYRLEQYQMAMRRQLYPVADMLPPLDMVFTFANESGVFSKMKLLGVTMIDEGGTMSVDDLITEQTFSYMARGIQPMTGFYLPQDVTV